MLSFFKCVLNHYLLEFLLILMVLVKHCGSLMQLSHTSKESKFLSSLQLFSFSWLVWSSYTAILFLWQWCFYLLRWKVFTVHLKLQLFMETYHAPFTPKHRYWTGLLLIAHAILYLVAAANVSNDPQLSLSAIIFTTTIILLLIAFIDIRMYKKMLLDILWRLSAF